MTVSRSSVIGLDGMRGLAAAMVFVCHLDQRVPLVGELAPGGRTGVLVFFVLSGYLLFRPFLEGPQDLRAYAARRFLRIYPAYLVALVGAAILTGDPSLWENPVAYLALVSNAQPELHLGFMGVAWTLTVEIVFYATLPLIALVCGRTVRRIVGVLVLLGAVSLAGSLATGWWLGGAQQNTLVMGLPPFLFWAFVPGMLIAVAAVHRPRALKMLRRPMPIVIGMVLIIAGVVLNPHPSQNVFTPLGSALIVGAFVAAPHWAALRAPMAAAAALSYSVYLWHDEVMNRFYDLSQSSPIPFVVIVLVLTLGIAAASYLLVERPAIRLGRRFGRARPLAVERAPTAAATPIAES